MTTGSVAPAKTRAQISERTLRKDDWKRSPRITAGRLNNFSSHPVRYWAWTKVSWLNARHMQFAWITLGTLMLTDLYIWLVAAGVFSDLRIYN